MNCIYRIVFNRRRNQWLVVAVTTRGLGGKGGQAGGEVGAPARAGRVLRSVAAALLAALGGLALPFAASGADWPGGVDNNWGTVNGRQQSGLNAPAQPCRLGGVKLAF